MLFDPARYGSQVAEILALDGNGARLLPLVAGAPSSAEAAERLRAATPWSLFPVSRAPEAALAGLWAYFSSFENAHEISQEIPGPDGSYWHGILHRQEPDAENAAYWFRRAGQHKIYPALRDAAAGILAVQSLTGVRPGFRLGSKWDPFDFVEFCGMARQRPGSEDELAARRITLAEWQLFFDHCAAPVS